MDDRNDNGESAAAFYDKRRRWLDYTCQLTHLSDRGFRLGHWLAKKMNGDDQCCWYRHSQIAKGLDWSEDKVARAVAELEAEFVLIVVRSHRKANYYYIRMPYETA